MTTVPSGVTLAAIRRAWTLLPLGPAFATPTSLLQPVEDESGRRCMLKLARLEEERRGGRALASWGGEGSAPVLRHDAASGALLLLHAEGSDLLAGMRACDDDAALDRIADVAGRLHAGRADHGELVPLDVWFRSLRHAAEARGGTWRRAWSEAASLLGSGPTEVPLHGDLHHGNVLDFGDLGWRAIDPKGLRGDPAFDFAAALLNPDRCPADGNAERLRKRAARLAARSGLGTDRVLAWTEAFAALSAAWATEDGTSPGPDLACRRTAWAARRLKDA